MNQPPNPYQQQNNPYAQQPSPYGQQAPGQYPGAGHNPYAPPTQAAYGYDADFGGEQVLAERGTRLVAQLIDGAIMLVGILPMIPALMMMADDPEKAFESGMAFFSIGILAMLAIGIYQIVLLSTKGQTIGKKAMGIKIVKMDGSEPGFVHAVLLRSWVMGLIGNIPVIGPLVTIADPFLIFAEDRRCIHDHVAGTKVVVA